LNNLVVVAYPNIPLKISDTLAEILNKNIANENYLNTRVRNSTIETPLSEAQILAEQPRGYTMEDIGNLERRIKDLEYYVSLTLLESDMKDRVIPSSIDPTISRFKHGFFVDDFTTSLYSEVDHKSYSATVENDDVMPSREIITLSNPDDIINQNYIEYSVVSQKNATGVLANNVVSNVAASANTWFVRKEPSSRKSDTFNITLASSPGPVSLYGHFYGGADSIRVYQGNTLLKISNTTYLENLSSADKTKLQSNVVPNAWFKNIKFADFGTTSVGGDPSVKNSFKITWNHNPANGREYTIKVQNHSVIWRYAVEAPINSSAVSNTAVDISGPVAYTGIMTVSPNKIDIKY
jgi:hypothetical protein